MILHRSETTLPTYLLSNSNRQHGLLQYCVSRSSIDVSTSLSSEDIVGASATIPRRSGLVATNTLACWSQNTSMRIATGMPRFEMKRQNGKPMRYAIGALSCSADDWVLVEMLHLAKVHEKLIREVKCIDLSLFQVLQKVTVFRFGVTRQIESEPKI